MCITTTVNYLWDLQRFWLQSTVDIRGTYLDISKAFDKIWSDGLILKLQTSGIDSNLLKLLKNYLKDQQQRVILNGQKSSWKNVLAGVPQRYVLGLSLFLIWRNDLPEGVASLCKIFADDTSLFSKAVNRTHSEAELNKDLELISQWVNQWKMLFNPDPTEQATEVCFSHKRDNVSYQRFNNNINHM